MKISIELNEATNGKFSDVRLCYINNNSTESKVSLMFNQFVKIFDFTDELKSVKFDFFMISSLVYGIDNLISRDVYSNDGWARDLEVKFPVYNLAVWQGNEGLLEETLKFLTGDYWAVSFVLNEIDNMFIPKYRRWTGYSADIDHLIPGSVDHLFRCKLTRVFRAKLTTPNEQLVL